MNEDALVKLGLDALLSAFVEVRTQFEVQPPAQFVDVFVARDASDPDAMQAALGCLADMAGHLALLEAFTSDLSIADARECQRKQLTLHHSLMLRAKPRANEDKPRVDVPFPWLWMLSWSRPRRLLHVWGMTPLEGWPVGFYAAPGGFHVGLVVLPELPKIRETLPLRMFGDERVRQGLRQEFDALPEGDPMRQALYRMLTYWELWVLGRPKDERTRWQMSLLEYKREVEAKLQKLKDDAVREGLQEGRQQGLQQGLQEGLQQGLQEGLREGILDLCELMALELTAAQRADLASRDLAGLEALRLHLKTHRAWP